MNKPFIADFSVSDKPLFSSHLKNERMSAPEPLKPVIFSNVNIIIDRYEIQPLINLPTIPRFAPCASL
ncbi:MAG: hypothetical protein AB1478_12365, partial [Nitrospirota bacterium]